MGVLPCRGASKWVRSDVERAPLKTSPSSSLSWMLFEARMDRSDVATAAPAGMPSDAWLLPGLFATLGPDDG